MLNRFSVKPLLAFRSVSFFVLGLVLFCLFPPGGWGAVAEKVDPLLAAKLQAPGSVPIPVIVTLVGDSVPPAKPQGVTDPHKMRAMVPEQLRLNAARNRAGVEGWLRAKGVSGATPLWINNSLALQASPDLIRQLAAHPGVARIRPDLVLTVPKPVRVARPLAAPLTAVEWNVTAVKAPELWKRGITGKGVIVASLDSGVDYRHNWLTAQWRGGNNSWFDPYGQHTTPFDAAGHGTATMGLIVGGPVAGTTVGIAPDAEWISAKIFDDSGQALSSNIHQGFQWLLDPDGDPATDDAPDVVNNSWGFNSNANTVQPEFLPDIQALKAAGIGVVFSAGNAGPGAATSVSPANYPNVLSVGAVGLTNGILTIADFSSRGPSASGGALFPLLVAPGAGVKSYDLTRDVDRNATAVWDGTSFSGPQVVGGMALLKSAFPTAPAEQIQAALIQSATDMGASGPDNIYGNGLMNLDQAYALLKPRFGHGATAPVRGWNYFE